MHGWRLRICDSNDLQSLRVDLPTAYESEAAVRAHHLVAYAAADVPAHNLWPGSERGGGGSPSVALRPRHKYDSEPSTMGWVPLKAAGAGPGSWGWRRSTVTAHQHHCSAKETARPGFRRQQLLAVCNGTSSGGARRAAISLQHTLLRSMPVQAASQCFARDTAAFETRRTSKGEPSDEQAKGLTCRSDSC